MSVFVYSFCCSREKLKDSIWLGDAAVFSRLDLLVKKLTLIGQNFVRTRDVSRYSDEEKIIGRPTSSKD